MSQPTFITKPSYDQLHSAMITMVSELLTHQIGAVVAPVRGGLMFGVVASHKLNVPLIPVSYSSKLGAGDDKNHANELPSLPSDVRAILLVDDIIDSGHTLAEITKHYRSQGIRVITAVIHYKAGATFRPDVYFWLIPADSEFIQYPYEAA